MSSTVRLVATDLDGTLVHSDGSVTVRTRAALSAAEEAGVQVVFVTGRPLRWAREVFEHVGPHGLAVVSNGALVWDVAADEPRVVRPIAPDVTVVVARRLRTELPDVLFATETVAGWSMEPRYATHPADDGSGRTPRRIAPIDELATEPILKLLGLCRQRDPDEMVAVADAAVGDLVTVTHSSFPLLEMSAAGVTKASTLALLCEELGITSDEVVAVGDMPNDLPMLTWAGTSYAMANAHPAVLAAADHVAGPNDDDGVAQVIEGLLDSRVSPRQH
ncbi:MAG TPA: Cof-type HAD-IIB family hydrolase [Marmoricola sp.]|nr:Cof-type HAD-IIB family hydrolase [Marmoricola sp.]